MTYEPQRWENSLVAQSYVAGDDFSTAARIDLSNFYEWNIHLQESVSLTGAPTKLSIYFEDPATHPNTARIDMGIMDPTMFDYQAGSLILSSNGVSFPTGQATIWITTSAPAPIVSLTVWGSRRV